MCWTEPAWAVLAYRLYNWASFRQRFLCLTSSLPLIWTSLSCHLCGTGLSGPAPTDKHTFSAHPKPQLQHSWRYILSTACFLAPIQPHNEWSRSPQPGASPSTLFTLLPFTRSSCSSPNDAGPSYCWSKAGLELFSCWLHFKPGHFVFWYWIPLLWNVMIQSYSFLGLSSLLPLKSFHIFMGLFTCPLCVVVSFLMYSSPHTTTRANMASLESSDSITALVSKNPTLY